MNQLPPSSIEFRNACEKAQCENAEKHAPETVFVPQYKKSDYRKRMEKLAKTLR